METNLTRTGNHPDGAASHTDSTDNTMTLPIHPARNAQTPPIDFDGWRHRIRQDVAWNYHFEMGVALQRTGDSVSAAASFSRAVEADPDRLTAQCGLFLALQHTGQDQAAVQCRSQALALTPNFDAQARTMELCFLADRHVGAQDYDQANSLLDEAAEFAHDASIRAEVVKRYSALCSHFLPLDKLRILDKAAAITPEDSALQFQIGMLYSEIPDGMEKAALAYGRALALDPTNLQLLMQFGYACLYLCRFDKAQDALQRALEQDPSRQRTVDVLGQLMLVQHRFAEAEQLLGPTVAANPTNLDLATTLILNKIAAGRLEEAQAAIDDGMRQNNTPYQPIFLNMLALIAQRKGQYGDAIALHSKAAAMAPHAVSIFIDWGFTLHLAGQMEEARAVQQAVVDREYRWFPLSVHLRPWATEPMKAVYSALGVAF